MPSLFPDMVHDKPEFTDTDGSCDMSASCNILSLLGKQNNACCLHKGYRAYAEKEELNYTQ